ncbi:hypothetical protein B9Z55_010577 [Caenorhabditis nigoni]|uniref:Cyclin N-terminal domain-containing protein n=1 Tax=Caenorhabditis nigoni TaxID=1611254 RepID=A0A2G5UGE4_9PELO|nr:hypothetical protein B9Z55_010577 [Caenorhabditis nigoni]
MSSSRSQPRNSSPPGTPASASRNKTLHNPNIKQNERESNPLVSREPDFFSPEGACHKIYWSDCIAQMAMDILERQKAVTACEFDFLKPKLVEYTFTVCVRLRLPNEVRFTAALILNMYLTRQLCGLHEFIGQQAFDVQKKNREWDRMETNMERQIPLRILTAIQISTKIHSYHDSLSSRQVVNTLRVVGVPYNMSAVMESEQRVFKLIGHSIPDSPLEACEMALKVLTYTLKKRGMEESSRHDDLWQHCLIVLDVCFINHIELYDRFMRKCPFILKEGDEKRLTMSKIKCDILLLASATIQTAFNLCIGKQHLSEVALIVNKLLRCHPTYVEPLRQSIIELAQSRKTVEFSQCDDV